MTTMWLILLTFVVRFPSLASPPEAGGRTIAPKTNEHSAARRLIEPSPVAFPGFSRQPSPIGTDIATELPTPAPRRAHAHHGNRNVDGHAHDPVHHCWTARSEYDKVS